MEKILIDKNSHTETVIDLVKEEKIKSRYGFVAILDALGTKNANFDEIKQFLISHIFVKEMISNKDFHQMLAQIDTLGKDVEIIQPDFFIFQDTVIITLDVGQEDNLVKYLNYFGTIVQYYISISFVNHMLFRGALSYGNYYEYEKNFFFGEAINDCSAWYEQPDLMGAISTPKFTNYLNDVNSKLQTDLIDSQIFNKKVFQKLFLSSIIPLKNNQIPGWIINWPVSLATQGTLPEDNIDPMLNALGVYYSLIKNYSVPKGTENKYINTTRFVQKVFEKFPEYLTILRPHPQNYDLFSEKKDNDNDK